MRCTTLGTVLLLCLTPLLVKAQKAFRPATLQLVSGDQLEGFIRYDSDRDFQDGISFKASLDGSTSKYKANEVKRFNFLEDEMIFESVLSNTDLDKSYKNRIGRVLVDGDIQLFKIYLTGKEKKIIKKGSNDLIYVLRMPDKDYRLELIEQKRRQSEGLDLYQLKKEYIGLLKLAFKECPDIHAQIDRLSFKDKAMINTLQLYQQCKGELVNITVQKTSKKDIRQGLTAGYLRLYDGPGGASNGFSLGYFIDVFNPERSKRFSLLAGANYHFFTVDTEQIIIGPSRTVLENVHGLGLLFQGTYRIYQSEQFTPYLSLGLHLKMQRAQAVGEDLTAFVFIPSPDVGVGCYINRFRLHLSWQNERLTRPNPNKFLAFEVGYLF
jgi:hypothetical protein